VTQAQFSLWTEAAAIEHSNGFADKPDHPAENMTWHQARSFCQWLMDTVTSIFAHVCHADDIDWRCSVLARHDVTE